MVQISKFFWASVPFAIFASILLSSPLYADGPDFKPYFKGKDGCFVLYDLKAKKVISRSNEKRCSERLSPCSTFKIPLSLMAFDQGVLKNEHTVLKWDGQERAEPGWNQDNSAESWMKHSIVWFSQSLTPELGMKKIKKYLADFDYGNQDMSAGLTKAWLSTSLKISADEQIKFLEKVWQGKLPVSHHAIEMTKRITYLEKSGSGAILHGKTGSGSQNDKKLGWFLGHLSRSNQEYLFVVNFTDSSKAESPEPAGRTAKAIALKILTDLKLF